MIEADEIKKYYDNFLSYLKNDHLKVNPRHEKVKIDLKQIIKKDFNVLDLGCGTGITTKYIAELGATVLGVDISPKLIEFAKENSIHPNAKYIVRDITEKQVITWQFLKDNEHYDAICLIDIMEHISRERINILLENLKFSSKDNTIIYLNIPTAEYQEFVKENFPERLQIIDESYPFEEILNLFKIIGFKPSRIETYGIDFSNQYMSYLFVKR